jgi:hypothetical protein
LAKFLPAYRRTYFSSGRAMTEIYRDARVPSLFALATTKFALSLHDEARAGTNGAFAEGRARSGVENARAVPSDKSHEAREAREAREAFMEERRRENCSPQCRIKARRCVNRQCKRFQPSADL